jgi:hypothetical protein
LAYLRGADVRTLAAVAVMLGVGCGSPPGACVVPYPDRPRGDGTACRTDLDETACHAERAGAAFTAGRTCPQLGYPCFTNALGGVLYDRRDDASGTCPEGTSE